MNTKVQHVQILVLIEMLTKTAMSHLYQVLYVLQVVCLIVDYFEISYPTKGEFYCNQKFNVLNETQGSLVYKSDCKYYP